MLSIYITDALKIIAENTGFYEGCKEMGYRYLDFINGKTSKTETEDKSGDEMANEFLDKLGVVE